MSNGRTYTLRNAASIVFALTAVIPLLLFTYTLYLLGQLGQSQAQMGLGVALGCALVGLFIFSNLMGRLGELLRFLEEQPAPVTPGGPAETSSAGDHAARPVSVATNGPASPSWPGPAAWSFPGSARSPRRAGPPRRRDRPPASSTRCRRRCGTRRLSSTSAGACSSR